MNTRHLKSLSIRQLQGIGEFKLIESEFGLLTMTIGIGFDKRSKPGRTVVPCLVGTY
jgi:hypothetical protein